jgi:uncharacterized membrane protein YfcA
VADLLTTAALSILVAGFVVGIVVGLTGMGGGALMTPALLFLGVGSPAVVVTADLTAAAIYKTGGAIVHKREGSPNMRLAMWLMIGSIPMALLGCTSTSAACAPAPTSTTTTPRSASSPRCSSACSAACSSASPASARARSS